MNYSRTSGQMVCKTAMLLAFMFAACSEDVGHSPVAQDGGYTEDTAYLNNINVVAHARLYVSENDSSAKNKLVGYVPSGSLLRMTELDSVNFDATDAVFYSRSEDSSGVFSFDSISLKSPYVMMELSADCSSKDYPNPISDPEGKKWADKCLSNREVGLVYHVLVDLRKSKEVSINVVTEMVTSRLMYLMDHGKSYEEARLQSEREMLDALGMYGVPYRFEKAVYDENRAELMFADYLNSWLVHVHNPRSLTGVIGTFAAIGSLNGEPSVKNMLIEYVEDWNRSEWVDDSTKQYLHNLVHNFMASLYGLEPCSAENEGRSTALPYDEHKDISFVCKAGAWSFSIGYVVPDSVGAVLGQMTDSRDGAKYNTVTYEIDGETQTWLAENLRYKAADGRYYWSDAMSLPESVVLVTYEECIEQDTYAYCDDMQQNRRNFNYERLWNVTDSVKAAGKTYQGVCPDGWHLPDANEWKKLRDYVEKKIDIQSLNGENVMSIAGFDGPESEGENLYVVKIDSSVQDISGYTDEINSTIILLYVENEEWTYVSLKQKNMNRLNGARYALQRPELFTEKSFSVRCIKD